jgi:2-octaprenyl-3-methyl-6-methoxy-1,4-benzoquinol hydroxylase/2-octaprenylphenol hydroxylase
VKVDIAISGGGMAGCALALSLAKTNLNIVIIEPNNPNPVVQANFHTRVSAITPHSQAWLETIGVWNLIMRKQVFTKTKVWDANSIGMLDFQSEEGLGHVIENDVLQSALYTALKNTSVLWVNSALCGLNKCEEGYQLNLEDNRSIACKLLIGADGAHSTVRTLAKIDYHKHNYQQSAIVCNVSAQHSFQQATWQRFLGVGIIAFLPLNEHTASIVLSTEQTLALDWMELDDEVFIQRLADTVENRFGKLCLLSKRQVFSLVARHAKTYVSANLALVGDAAHNIHPLAGQGINLGFKDVEELSQQLKANLDKFSHYSVLRKYARARRLDNELMSTTMTGLNWLYKTNNKPMPWLRGLGMNLINQTPGLKSFFQRNAIGR